MIKQKTPDDSVLAVSCVDKIKARLARDEKRFKHKRCVYMYRWTVDDTIMDNVILLDYSTRHAHKQFLESQIYSIIVNECKSKKLSTLDAHNCPFAHYEIIQVGTLDKLNMRFERLSHSKKIVDCNDLVFKYFDERKKHEKVSN